MVEAFILSFSTIFLAEFLDKSQLTILLLSSKTKKHVQLILGVIAAFAVVDGLAIFFGSEISRVVSPLIIHLLAGLLFIFFGLSSLRSSDSQAEKTGRLSNPFISGFTLVFLSEWGDKTQIASALFAVKYPPLYVFFGVICALSLLSILAITVGSTLLKRVKRKTVSTISGIVFILLGILFLLS